MLEYSEYLGRRTRKKRAYLEEGISEWSVSNPAGRLIVTHDDPKSGLDSKILHGIAAQI